MYFQNEVFEAEEMIGDELRRGFVGENAFGIQFLPGFPAKNFGTVRSDHLHARTPHQSRNRTGHSDRQARPQDQRADALAYVAGYAIGLDITIRGPEERSYRKSLDTFSVLGRWLVTADEFGDPAAVDFEIKVNGESRQKANTRDLIFDTRKLLAYASSAYTLEPGDIIMTGTPEGVALIFPGDATT